MVDLILESPSTTFHGVKVADSDMADVLRALAVAGQGVAWLPDCTASQAPPGSLVALGDASWTLPLSIVAYRDRASKRAAVQRLWTHLEHRSLSGDSGLGVTAAAQECSHARP
jgi:DNA-binding transcriptional LysR family regulator